MSSKELTTTAPSITLLSRATQDTMKTEAAMPTQLMNMNKISIFSFEYYAEVGLGLVYNKESLNCISK